MLARQGTLRNVRVGIVSLNICFPDGKKSQNPTRRMNYPGCHRISLHRRTMEPKDKSYLTAAGRLDGRAFAPECATPPRKATGALKLATFGLGKGAGTTRTATRYWMRLCS